MSRLIPLTRGLFAVVDDADYEFASQFRWIACPSRSTFYAHRTIYIPQKKTVSIHSVLTGWDRVDHIDGDGLNNQRANLRPATRQENQRNSRKKRSGATSQFKGVSLHLRGKWLARIRPSPGEQRHIGVFASEVEAARAYDAVAREIFGPFARPNFPDMAGER